MRAGIQIFIIELVYITNYRSKVRKPTQDSQSAQHRVSTLILSLLSGNV